MKKLTLKTKEGCWRLLAIFLIIILLSSFAARLVSSDGGKVKISRVTFDSRGATINADLYYPKGTTDKDSLPAVLVAHGGGVAKGVVQGIAEEIARRGFVVLNVDAYGSGLSEQPQYDDGGQGVEAFNPAVSPGGMLDALNFLRTLNFVDKTRTGMVGHSMGARRVASAAVVECGYYTLNDVLINVLYNDFGLDISVEEIGIDADELAYSRLNEDQLVYYESIKAEKQEEFNNKLKAACIIGGDPSTINPRQVVEVAGHEVLRNCQVNLGVLIGTYDFNQSGYNSKDSTKDSWYTNGESASADIWYALDDVNECSTQLGAFGKLSVLDSADLKAAIDSKSTRVLSYNVETHSKNFFSGLTTEDIVQYFEQTLSYNGGELGSPEASPVAASSTIFFWREIFNFIALLAMVGVVLSVAGILLNIRFFSVCVATKKSHAIATFSKKKYWAFSFITVVITFVVMYITNTLNAPMLPWFKSLPLFPSWWLTVLFLAMLALGSILLLVAYWVIDRKKAGNHCLSILNTKQKPVTILKTILLAAILLAVAYTSLVLIEYLFNEDYRFWMIAFTEMKVEYWGLVWKYALIMFPCFLLIGAATNYSVRSDISERKDTIITVIINSLGAWLLCAINYCILRAGGDMFSSFISTYGFLIFVPITVYITRKLYNITHSIWAGAAVNAFLMSWSICSTVGLHCFVFYGQTWASNFFNI